MLPTEMHAFSKQMTGVCVIYNRTNSLELTEIYFNCLADYDFKDVVDAIGKYVKSTDKCDFFPKPGDLIKMIQGDIRTLALQAFSKARGSAGISSYDTVVFDDPIIHLVIRDMGGWLEWGMMTTHELPFKEKIFCERYEGYFLNPPAEYPKMLYGIYELKEGHEPKMIGDKNKAQLVLECKPAAEIFRFKLSDQVLLKNDDDEKLKAAS